MLKIEGGNSFLSGEVNVQGDKSISHRSVMLGAIAEGETVVDNFLMSDDCLATINCFRDMGVDITYSDSRVKIKGVGLYGLQKPNKTLDVGNSGTTIRLISGILAGQKFSTTISGDESIRKRPMGRIIVPLRLMGANIKGKDDKFAPLEIKPTDKLKDIKYDMPIASAQVKSCILLAGLYSKGITEIFQPSISRDHTERILELFGVDISIAENKVILDSSKLNEFEGQRIFVPGDISSAAFFMVGALLLKGSNILIRNVGLNHTRTGIIDVLKEMGGKIKEFNIREVNNEPIGDIQVEYSKLKGVTIEGDIIPRLIDEIPIIALAASLAEGKTVIRNAEELKKKESNRIEAIVKELNKMGGSIVEIEDGMIINGVENLNASEFETYNDHRIAMTLAIASLIAKGQSTLNEIDSINVSFPNFFHELNKLKKLV